jgi:hypothetical protein
MERRTLQNEDTTTIYAYLLELTNPSITNYLMIPS